MKHLIHFKTFLILFFLFGTSCNGQKVQQKIEVEIQEELIEEELSLVGTLTGAEVLQGQLHILEGKALGLLVNPTSMVGEYHLVDLLRANEIDIAKIFAPEHGFRGTADAGEKIADGIDPKTNIPVVSLYGNHKKPSKEDLEGVDVMIFDVQDVGARFYTYISTLHYLMEACAENDLPLIVLDRPNPNGDIVDGMVLDLEYKSFIGMHPIPVLHGMTIGEYAQMINGESWLKDGLKCDLKVIPCANYDHSMSYDLPVKPSPNLPDARAIKLYPSTCFFEGTVISEGRGTNIPFQVFGAPEIPEELVPYSFVPKSKAGAKYPKFENKTCYGFNISTVPNDFKEQKEINLDYLITMYNIYPNKESFFLKNGFFDLLAGGTELRKEIVAGKSAEEIKASWQEDLTQFKKVRKQYLLYPDFE